MMIAGPAGAGKTMTALEVATSLGEKVLVIDTEKESALTYADVYEFDHLPWSPPYDPRELARTLYEAADEYDSVIVDSLSHFWRKQGGTLDIAEGKFSGWKVARPAQEDLIEAILGSDAHVLVCVRSKIEHVQEVDASTGKHVVKKLGLAPQQDDTLEYELNLAVEIDIEHRIAVSKSRTTAVPVGTVFPPGHARDLAVNYGTWLGSGEAFADADMRKQIESEIAGLSEEDRKALGAEWRTAGLPKVNLLTVSQAEAAQLLVARARADGVVPVE